MVEATQPTGGNLAVPQGQQPVNRATISQDQFLTLLIAELSNQDPLSPITGQEMASQLAQFGTLERLYSIDQQIGANLDIDLLMTQAVTNTMAASLIGREVEALGDSVTLSGGQADLHFRLEDAAAEVTITLLDESGQVVRTIQLTDLLADEHDVVWNGMDASGQNLSDGVYHLAITASDAGGNVVNAFMTSSGIITGVSYETGTAVLMVGELMIPMGNVITIRIPEG